MQMPPHLLIWVIQTQHPFQQHEHHIGWLAEHTEQHPGRASARRHHRRPHDDAQKHRDHHNAVSKRGSIRIDVVYDYFQYIIRLYLHFISFLYCLGVYFRSISQVLEIGNIFWSAAGK